MSKNSRSDISEAISVLGDALIEVFGGAAGIEGHDRSFIQALREIARELRNLGNAGAITESGTELGAVEGHSMKMQEAGEYIGDSIEEGCEAIEKGLEGIAAALKRGFTELAKAVASSHGQTRE